MKALNYLICVLFRHDFSKWYSEYTLNGQQHVNFYCRRCGKDELTASQRHKRTEK